VHAAELGEEMKKPQSVYLDELVHSRVSQMVENALDGYGSLGGFFAFIEEKALYFHERLPEVHNDDDLVALLDVNNAAQKLAEIEEKAGLTSGPELEELLSASTADIHAYLEAWNLAAPTLPWHQENPAVSHVLALYLLSFNPFLWQEDLKSSASGPDPAHGFFFQTQSLAEVVAKLQLAGTQRGARQKWYPWLKEFYPAVWQRGRVDILNNNSALAYRLYGFHSAAETKPKVKPTSFYLSKPAHDFVYAIFGNDLYNSAEHALHRLFTKTDYWIDITPETRFLEHGMELFDLEPEVFLRGRGLSAIEDWCESDDEVEDKNECLRTELLAKVWNPFWETFSPFRAADEHGWGLNLPPPLRLAHRLGVYRVDGPESDWARVEEGVAAQHDTVLATFLRHYQLQSLVPERSIAYRILKDKPLPEVKPEVFHDPVEYHLFELFRLYAREVLPESECEEVRLSLPVLATLAQSWVFPTRSALEAYSTAKVRKTAQGKWQLLKGNKTLMELTNAEAFKVAWVLWALVPPLMSYGHPGEESGMADYDHWLEDYESQSPAFREYLRREGRLSMTTGPAFVERVLELVRKRKKHKSEGDGVSNKLFYCIRRLHHEVIDKALGGNGAIAAELAEEYDMKG
jgi:hypothetical protein